MTEDMAMLPNDSHPGAGCSCADCLRKFPSVVARRNVVWIIYDGRADVDEDEAAVLEACSSRRDLKRALWHWRGHDGVLFEYDANQDNELSNGRRVGRLSVGQSELMRRASRREVTLMKDETL